MKSMIAEGLAVCFRLKADRTGLIFLRLLVFFKFQRLPLKLQKKCTRDSYEFEIGSNSRNLCLFWTGFTF
jgi:hypothetical protein